MRKERGTKGLISNLEMREGDLKTRLKDDISRGLGSELLLYALLRAKRAKDFMSQLELTTADFVFHHIFPKAILSGLSKELINDVGNMTITTENTNRRLLSERPKNYIAKIPPEIIKTHFISDNPDLWKIEKYEQFLQERRELLKKQ